MKQALVLFLLLIMVVPVAARTAGSSIIGLEQGQTITLTRDLSMENALKAIEVLSQQAEGKKIINTSTYTGPINTPVNSVSWREALKLITGFNNLVLQELPGAFMITDYTPEAAQAAKNLNAITFNTPQVKISAIFFKADRNRMNNIGIDWSTMANGKVVASIKMSGASQLTDKIAEFGASTSVNSGQYTIDINTLLNVLESNNVGDVLARPNVTVISGKEGYIQVGEDFSIKTTDESGNLSDEFFSTGIILRVEPKVVEDEGNRAIHLKARVEKSSAQPGQITTIINKNQSETEVMLYDGEETVVGGLYENETDSERGGVPLLKDLPWWFFGLRYLFGYERHTVKSSEMIIVLKAQIMESNLERMQRHQQVEDAIDNHYQENERARQLFKIKDKEARHDK